MDPPVTFTLDGYEPVAFHTYPALMRAADAHTEVLHPATDLSASTVAMATTQADRSAPETPTKPVQAYLVGIDATPVLREQLADFLDAAGPRRDVWVSVGVGSGSSIDWVLRTAVPYGVRALPRYPDTEPVVDPAAVVAAAISAVATDSSDQADRRRLLIVVWGRPPTAVRLPGSPASALIMHCLDAELDWLPADGWGPSLLLSRSRARPRRSMLAQAGRLLTGWEAFRDMPDGLVLARLS